MPKLTIDQQIRSPNHRAATVRSEWSRFGRSSAQGHYCPVWAMPSSAPLWQFDSHPRLVPWAHWGPDRRDLSSSRTKTSVKRIVKLAGQTERHAHKPPNRCDYVAANHHAANGRRMEATPNAQPPVMPMIPTIPNKDQRCQRYPNSPGLYFARERIWNRSRQPTFLG